MIVTLKPRTKREKLTRPALTDIFEALYKLGYNSTLKAFIREVQENWHYQKVQFAEYRDITVLCGRLAMEEVVRDAETEANH